MIAAFGVEVLNHRRPWLARLERRDDEVSFVRTFMDPHEDYRRANESRSRGVWFWWPLEPGKPYETRYFTGTRTVQRFLIADESCAIRDLTRDEVRQNLPDWRPWSRGRKRPKITDPDGPPTKKQLRRATQIAEFCGYRYLRHAVIAWRGEHLIHGLTKGQASELIDWLDKQRMSEYLPGA